MSKTIVYRDRAEIKMLSIGIGIVWLPLYSFVTINDLIINNPVFGHNQKFLWTLAIIFALPIIIVARYRIKFDFEQRVLTCVRYFSLPKKYCFDELNMVAELNNSPWGYRKYTFYKNGKKIFVTTDVDFEFKTREKADCLNEFLSGDGKFIYDVERSIEQAGYTCLVYKYAFTKPILIIYNPNNFNISISVDFDIQQEKFILTVSERQFDRDDFDAHSTLLTLETVTVDKEQLKETILQLINQYSNS